MLQNEVSCKRMYMYRRYSQRVLWYTHTRNRLILLLSFQYGCSGYRVYDIIRVLFDILTSF